MRTRIFTATALGLALALAAGAVQAADLRYTHPKRGSGLLEDFDGKAYWALFAQCAGMHGAVANAQEAAGDPRAAAQSEASGVYYFDKAVKRLVRDRRLSEARATELALAQVDRSRDGAARMVEARTVHGVPATAYITSLCLDLDAAYGGR